MGPEAKLSGLPAVKYRPKVPPIAGSTVEVPGAKVRVPPGGKVKESFPKAPKKPVMESACATATLLVARTKSMRRRFIIEGFSWGAKNLACEKYSHLRDKQVQSQFDG
jgi:hypothetical protein